MKMALGSESLKTTRTNRTIYVCHGTRDGVTAEQRANLKERGALWLEPRACPTDSFWPVDGCGVIVLDYAPMDERTAQLLGLALKRDGALPGTVWANIAANSSSVII